MNLIVICLVLAIIYGIALWYWIKKVKWNIRRSATNWLIGIHLALLVLVVAALILSIAYNLFFRGMWTTRVIIVLFLVTGIPTYIIGDRQRFNKFTRGYFFAFSILPLLTGLLMILPFLGPVILLSLFGRLSGTGDDVHYDTQEFRIQSTFLGILGPPWLEIYQKSNILEKRIYRSESGWWGVIDSVRFETANGIKSIEIYHHDDGEIAPMIKLPINSR